MAHFGSVDRIRQPGVPDEPVEIVAEDVDCWREIAPDWIGRGKDERPDPGREGGAVLQVPDVVEEALLPRMRGPVHGEDDVEDARQQGRQPVLQAETGIGPGAEACA